MSSKSITIEKKKSLVLDNNSKIKTCRVNWYKFVLLQKYLYYTTKYLY